MLLLEDSIMQKGLPVTAGSKILENFISPINATVVDRLLDNKIKIAGKTTPDEFGIIDIFSQESGVTAEAVKAVADNNAEYSLCNDIFGKYRRQAAENGLCYIHPTYGTVSRFGLVPSVSSMDQIGVVCKNLSDGFKLLSFIAGNDGKDGIMFPEKNYDYTKSNKNITFGIPNSVLTKTDQESEKIISELAKKFNTVNIELEYFDVYKQVMYILSCAEISANISRYDGIKFGYRSPEYKNINDLYLKTRTEGFGSETKLAAVMGTMVLSSKYYNLYCEKAMKIRRLIKDSLFKNYDIIILPCKISNDSYENLSLYALANLAGLPSVSFSYMGHGIQLIANTKNENLLFTAWEVYFA